MKGQQYRGLANQTKRGVVCQRWDSQKPHSHAITSNTHRDSGLNENFCRNPDGEPHGPWCYTTSPAKRWDYCDVPLCDPCKGMTCNYYSKCAPSENGKASCQCNLACPLIYKPVCGSDGKEYANKCVMEYESCTSKKMIYVVRKGKCNDKNPCDDMTCNYYSKCAPSENGKASCQCNLACRLIYKPVCGSDGKDYANKCVMEYESCTSKKMIYVVRKGKCNDKTIPEDIQNMTVITGYVVLSSEQRLPVKGISSLSPEVKSKSCLIITLREAVYCQKFEECPDFTIATNVIRNFSAPRDTLIRYRLKIRSKLKPGRYLIDATLNRGWCHMDDTDERKWIRNGDFFNDVEHSIQIDKPGHYDKDILIIDYKGNRTKMRKKYRDTSKSECRKERQNVFDSFPVIHGKKRPLLGAFIPQCNEDGSYKEVQCHGSTGYCWCVDENGKKKEETEVRFKRPNCEKGNTNKSECEKERQNVFDSFPVIHGKKRPLLGAFIPQCNEDGSYKEVQCHGSTGYCWCVDENGKKKEETEVRFKRPNCEKEKTSKCEMERKTVFDSFPIIDGNRVPRLGAYIPQCNEDGSYKDIQCSEMRCWCVYENGTKREGTEVQFSKPNCDNGNKSKCDRHRQRVFDTFPVINGKKQSMPGAYIPQCNEDGSYKEVQCHGSTGNCWCVDENGKKKEETEVRFKEPNC